jgi:Domain of unknown function (DUF4397)
LENTMNIPVSKRSSALLVTGTLAVAVLLGLSTGTADAAPASPPPVSVAPSATDGWLRVAHLSPDTKAVDVTVSDLSGGKKLFELDDVAYGTVSPYEHFPAGTYTISMTPWSAKSATKAKPILSASVKIVKGKSVTVAAFGSNRHLQTKVFQDNLTAPASGDSRVRIIQASTITKSVTVTTSAGALIASDARSGTSTDYATVSAGTWVLNVRGNSMTDASHLALASGSVETLFVLDTASGGFVVKPVLDSSGVGTDPIGGISTGGGWAATHDPAAVGLPAAG